VKSLLRRRAPGRRLLFLCGLVPAVLAAVLSLSRPPFLAALDDSVYDALLRAASPRPPTDRVVIVDADERSLTALGQWPWPRDLVSRLVARLRDLGASAVGLDIFFAEPDRHQLGEAAGEAAPRQGALTPDGVLAATVAEGGVVLGYGLTFDGGPRAPTHCGLHPLGLAIVQPQDDLDSVPFFRATGAVCNLPILGRSARATGFLNAAPDADGILRRVPLVLEHDGKIYPSLALAAVTAATGARPVTLRVANATAVSLVFEDGTAVPLDGKSNLLVRFRGKKHTLPYVSAVDVLEGRVSADVLRGRVAFVGTTALGTREVVATPLDTLFTGVEVQGTVADNLLDRDFVRRHEFGTLLETQAVLALGLAAALLLSRTGLLWGSVAGFGGLAALWWGAAWLLSERGVFLSPLFPTIGLVSGVGVMTLAKATIERRRAERAGEEKAATQRLMVASLLSLTEIRDVETGRHSRRTERLTRLLAGALAEHPEFHDDLTPERVELLSSLAPLHDIGKVGVPDHILGKPGALTPDELAEMRRHPAYGRDVILNAERGVGVRDDAVLELAKEIVYTHHERWDGTGYPEGLKGAEIPVPGRVIAIVDVYDAARTRTLYRRTISHEEVVDLIVNGRGTAFDPAVVDAFLRVAPAFRAIDDEGSVPAGVSARAGGSSRPAC